MSSIPAATIARLVTYLRVLTDMEQAGVRSTSSDDLGQEAHVSAFQVRKDLAYFGRFGTRGAGYTVATLRRELRKILGLTRPWHVAIMGMGRLGQALAHYPSFDQQEFELVAAFDVDNTLVGKKIGRVTVNSVDDLPKVAREREIDLVFLTVPAHAAQAATDRLVAAGVRGILSFAPTTLNVPEGVRVEGVDLSAGLQRLTYYVQGTPNGGVAG